MSKIQMAVWEQLENETDEEFELFKIFRTLNPSERNTIKTWEIYSERNDLDKKYNKKLEKISEKNNWYERSIQFDSYYEQTLLDYTSKDQYRDLISFKKRQRELSHRLAEVSLGLIRVAQQRLLTIKAEELNANLLPKYITAAAQIASLASESEASALMLNDLANLMQNEINSNVEEKEDLSVWEN